MMCQLQMLYLDNSIESQQHSCRSQTHTQVFLKPQLCSLLPCPPLLPSKCKAKVYAHVLSEHPRGALCLIWGCLGKLSWGCCCVNQNAGRQAPSALLRQSKMEMRWRNGLGSEITLCFLQYYKHSYSIDHFTLHYLEYNNAISFTIVLSVPD